MIKKTPFILLKRFLIWLTQAFDGVRIRVLPQSLFYRFILIILLPLIFLQTVMFIFFYDRHWQTVSRRLAADVTSETTIAISVLFLYLISAAVDAALKPIAAVTPPLIIFIIYIPS